MDTVVPSLFANPLAAPMPSPSGAGAAPAFAPFLAMDATALVTPPPAATPSAMLTGSAIAQLLPAIADATVPSLPVPIMAAPGQSVAADILPAPNVATPDPRATDASTLQQDVAQTPSVQRPSADGASVVEQPIDPAHVERKSTGTAHPATKVATLTPDAIEPVRGDGAELPPEDAAEAVQGTTDVSQSRTTRRGRASTDGDRTDGPATACATAPAQPIAVAFTPEAASPVKHAGATLQGEGKGSAPIQPARSDDHQPVVPTDATAAANVSNAPADNGPAVSQPSFATHMRAASPATHDQTAPAAEAGVVAAQPGRIGHETGVVIARRATDGADTVAIRLDPVEMGRIEVKLSFEDGGALRAVVAADNPASLDMLRRDSSNLIRALSDAGISTDAQSFRFDTRSDDRGNGSAWQSPHRTSSQGREDLGETPEDPAPIYRRFATQGRVDVMA